MVGIRERITRRTFLEESRDFVLNLRDHLHNPEALQAQPNICPIRLSETAVTGKARPNQWQYLDREIRIPPQVQTPLVRDVDRLARYILLGSKPDQEQQSNEQLLIAWVEPEEVLVGQTSSPAEAIFHLVGQFGEDPFKDHLEVVFTGNSSLQNRAEILGRVKPGGFAIGPPDDELAARFPPERWFGFGERGELSVEDRNTGQFSSPIDFAVMPYIDKTDKERVSHRKPLTLYGRLAPQPPLNVLGEIDPTREVYLTLQDPSNPAKTVAWFCPNVIERDTDHLTFRVNFAPDSEVSLEGLTGRIYVQVRQLQSLTLRKTASGSILSAVYYFSFPQSLWLV